MGWMTADYWIWGADNDMSGKVLLAGYGVVAIPGTCVWDAQSRDRLFQENQDRVGASDVRLYEARWVSQQDALAQAFAPWASVSGPIQCPHPHA